MWSSTAPPPPPPALPPPPVPPPSDPSLKHRIDTLALFAARNGPAFVDYTREQQRGNPDFAFLEPGDAEGGSYFDFKLYEALFAMERREAEAGAAARDARAGAAGADADDDDAVAAEVAEAMREEQEAARREAARLVGGGRGHQRLGVGVGGVGSERRKPPKPTVDAFDLPPGLIPELVSAARSRGSSSFKPLDPIPAGDAEAAARVAEREFPPSKVFGSGGEEENDDSDESEAERVLSSKLSTPYLSARLAALEAELEAYVPGMTRADLEEKLSAARGFGGAARGGALSSSWEQLIRRRAAEAAARGKGADASSFVAPGATPVDDGRFEGPRWLDRAGVGFEYRGGAKKRESDAAPSAAAAAGDPSTAAAPSSLLLDADLASFREQRSRQYHSEGNPRARRRREQQQRR